MTYNAGIKYIQYILIPLLIPLQKEQHEHSAEKSLNTYQHILNNVSLHPWVENLIIPKLIWLILDLYSFGIFITI